MGKIMPNKFKKIQNTPKRVSKRGIKSLENNFSVKATKDIINTPKTITDELEIVTKPEVVTLPKIVSKPEIAPKPKKVSEPKIVIKKKNPITVNIKIV